MVRAHSVDAGLVPEGGLLGLLFGLLEVPGHIESQACPDLVGFVRRVPDVGAVVCGPQEFAQSGQHLAEYCGPEEGVVRADVA